MKKTYLSLIISSLLISCASLPPSTSTLTKEVINEANDMHTLNIALINQLFEERKDRLNSFITDTYTPALVENYQKMIPDSINYKEQLPNILKSIIPVINRKKDSLQGLLDTQQQEIITSLNTNYITYTQATTSLQNLIDATIKVTETEENAVAKIQKLTGTSNIDFKKIEQNIDSTLIKVSKDTQPIIDLKKLIKQ